MPAARPSWPPRPGVSSTLWTTVPGGMLTQRQAVADADVGAGPRLDGRARPSAARARGCSASRRRRSAAARCRPSGSGRTRCARPCAGIPSFWRLKSILPVQALGAAATVARGLAPVGVASAGLRQSLDERLLRLGARDLGEIRIRDEPHPGEVGLGLRIGITAPAPLQPAEDRDRVALADLDDRLLPLRGCDRRYGRGAWACS